MNVGLADFFKHNLWANLRLLDTCAQLTGEQLEASAPGTYGSIRDTLVHLFRAEASYLARLPPTRPQPENQLPLDELPGIEVLREQARLSGEGLIAVAATVDPAHILRETDRGKSYEMPVIVPLMQAIHHAAEHRCHVATVLSQIGIQPPDLSVWAYDEELYG